MAKAVPDEIRDAAGKMTSAATESRKHKPDEVGGVAEALPSSTAGPLATTLGETWKTRFSGWAKDVDTQATSMKSAADTWGDTDAATRARMERQARIMDGEY
ncbi:hypothetical protein ASG90_12055 [Nocardioides sp. Soil797]|nr:hypothetical protein ASG90_12055 [Nocardioides sp. Soil797]